MERQREAERKELVGCKDGDRQINERKLIRKGELRKRDIQRERQER